MDPNIAQGMITLVERRLESVKQAIDETTSARARYLDEANTRITNLVSEYQEGQAVLEAFVNFVNPEKQTESVTEETLETFVAEG